MHRYFAEWHRAVGGDLVDIDLSIRWEVVETTAKSLTSADTIQMVELAFERVPNSNLSEQLAASFQEVEPTFPMRNNTRLLAVLSGAVVERALMREDAIACVSGYAVVAASALGWMPLVEDLVDDSKSFLSAAAEQLRSTEHAPLITKPVAWTKALSTEFDEASSTQDPARLTEWSKSLAESTQAALDVLASALSETQAWTERIVRSEREQTSMLSWLLSGGGADFSQRHEEATPAALAVIAGWELAELVSFLPAPQTAPRFLRQLLAFLPDSQNRQDQELADSIAAIPQDAVRPAVAEAVIDFTPILAKANGRDIDSTLASEILSLPDLASRAYTEVLLTRALGEVN